MVLAAVMCIDGRTRGKLMSDEQFNVLHGIANGIQLNASAFWAPDKRSEVLHARLIECVNAYRGVSF